MSKENLNYQPKIFILPEDKSWQFYQWLSEACWVEANGEKLCRAGLRYGAAPVAINAIDLETRTGEKTGLWGEISAIGGLRGFANFCVIKPGVDFSSFFETFCTSLENYWNRSIEHKGFFNVGETIRAVRAVNADFLEQCLYTASIAKHEGDYPLVFFWGEQADQVCQVVNDKIETSRVWNSIFRIRFDQEARQAGGRRLELDQIEEMLVSPEDEVGSGLIEFLGLSLETELRPIFESIDNLRVQIATLGKLGKFIIN